MDIFLTLFTNILPLYALIALGWIAGRFFGIELKGLSSLTINIFAPFAVFGFIMNIDFRPEYLLLPFLGWLGATLIAMAFLNIGRAIYPDSRANLLAMATSMGNTGFFGIPVALVIFSPETVGIYALIDIGVAVYMSTVLYYIASRGQFTVRQSLVKLSRFPMIYAVLCAVILSSLHVELSPLAGRYHGYFVGGMVVSGMMILGVSLSRMDNLIFSWRFAGLSYVGKFVVWPLVVAVFIWLDQQFFQLFDVQIYKAFLLLALVPIGNTVVAYAGEMDISPAKASMTVLLSTFIALLYIPLMLMLFDWLMAVTG